MTPVSVLLADDHALWRQGVRHVLEADDTLKVVAEAANAASVLLLAAQHHPNIILLDISLPDGNGIELLPNLRRVSPESQIIMLSVHDHPEYVLRSVRAGASGYLRKDSTPEELGEAIRAVRGGATFFGPHVAAQLGTAIRAEEDRQGRVSKLNVLSPRERDVLRGVAGGATSKEIGQQLGISPRTVETHRESLMRKLDIKSVAGLTRFAIEIGLLDQETKP